MPPPDQELPSRSSLSSARRLLLCSVGSAMIALAFPRVSWSLLAPFALVPILLGTTGLSVARATLFGWLGGVTGYVVACSWMLHAVTVFQGVSTLQAVLPFAVIQVYHGGQFAAFAGLVTWLRAGRAWTPVLATASWWGLLEWGYPKIAHWSLGNVTIDWPWVPQFADIMGVWGVSLLMAATSVVICNAVLCTAVSRRRRWTPVAVLAGCYVAAAMYGAIRTRHLADAARPTRVDVAVIQGALPVGDPNPARASARSWTTYSTASLAPTLRGVDVVFWPETTIRGYLRHGSPYTPQVQRLAISLDVNLVLGALDLPPRGPGEYSAAYLFEVDGSIQRAHKLRLLPFGEYVPGSQWVPWLSSWKTTGSFLPGTQHAVLRAGDIGMATSICLEGAYSGFNNDQLRDGATLLVNLSDDTRYGDSNLPYMHLQAVRWRAIEARRWMVRASNSGISAIVDPTGRVVASLPLGQAGTMRQSVFLETGITRFVRWGHWVLWVEVVMVLLGCAVRVSKR